LDISRKKDAESREKQRKVLTHPKTTKNEEKKSQQNIFIYCSSSNGQG